MAGPAAKVDAVRVVSVHTRPMIGGFFEGMHASGRAAVLEGCHRREDAPWVTRRWGLSVVAIIEGDAAAALDRLTGEASEVAGAGHWQSARRGRAHVTVRALAPFSHAAADPVVVARYVAALERAATNPFELTLDGMVLSPAGVLLRCGAPGGEADATRARFGEALGADGWLEDEMFANGRDPIWYLTLLHFAGPIADPDALVGWVERQGEVALGSVRVDALSLCRWDLDEHGMAPTVLASVGLPRQGVSGRGG
jgi:2'-5' RNA ligase